MKRKNYILAWTLLVAMVATSCLNDNKYALDPEGTQNVIEFVDPSVPISTPSSVYPAWVTSFTIVPEVTLTQSVAFAGPQSNDKDIQLQLAVDPIALDEYNEQNGTDYSLIDESYYDIPSLTVTIPKGQKQANFVVKIYPEEYDLTKTFALPLRIVSASSGILSKKYSAGILVTVVKNKYDGIYHVESAAETASGGMVDVTNAAFTGVYPKTIELVTVDGNTVNYYDHDYDLQGTIFHTGTGLSYYGGFSPQFKFDASTDVVSAVVNAFGQGNNNRSGKLDPAQTTTPVMTFKSDGTPDRLEIWYIMRQINTSVDRTFYKEIYTYEGPRD
ncbi:MAG: hypothetical protein BroJett042_20450 [Bacteroidota bacterium]|nr:MAG: hypothetical protein BroJett042_20450 [Bacteroidota bacterium]